MTITVPDATLPSVVTSIQYLVGFALPPAIDIINKNIANPKIKYLVSLLISIAVAFAIVLPGLKPGAEPVDILGVATLIFAEAQTVYHLYWKDSTPRAKALDLMTKQPVTPEAPTGEQGQG